MKYIFLLSLLLLFIGCSNKQTSINIQNPSKIVLLQKNILSISSSIEKKEALYIATTAIHYSKYLKKEYKIFGPPLFHNTLVNLGFKEKGLCYHYAKDIIKELKKTKLKTLDIRWAVSKKGEYFEHNTLVITAKDKGFEEGIVLDAWRDPGKLFFSFVKDDEKYTWSEYLYKSKRYGTIK